MSDPKLLKTRKVTFSCSALVWKRAEEMMELEGYDNVSAFIAELIRAEKRRQEERAAKKAGRSPKSGSRSIGGLELNEGLKKQ